MRRRGNALSNWMIGGLWLLGSGVMTVYLLWPCDVPPCRRAGGLSRFLRGYLGIGGTLRVCILLAAGLWWATAAGLVNADALRNGLVLAQVPVGGGGTAVPRGGWDAWVGSGIVLVVNCVLGIAMLNAGRRAALPALACLCLAGALSALLLLLVQTGGRTLLMFATGG